MVEEKEEEEEEEEEELLPGVITFVVDVPTIPLLEPIGTVVVTVCGAVWATLD